MNSEGFAFAGGGYILSAARDLFHSERGANTVKDQRLEIESKLRQKQEQYRQAVERHEFLEQVAIKEELEKLQMEWHRLIKETG